MKLNIIGNGFDLFHGLPSSYYYFGCYLIENDPEFFELIGDMYSIKYRRMIGPPIAHDFEYVVEDMLWKDFEGYLGKVDENFILDLYKDDLGLECSDAVEIEMNEDESAERLKKYFDCWVKETLDVSTNYKIIKSTLTSQDFDLVNSNDYFVVFNYTHILQQIYNVPENQIVYVHGESKTDGENDLIIGHGNDRRIEKLKDRISKLEEDCDFSQSSQNRIDENKCLLRYLERLRKNVSLCMMRCDKFYDSINEDVDIIKVYGLSLGEVDIPYLLQLRHRFPEVKWEFSYYSDDDIVRIDMVAEDILKLGKARYEKFLLDNPEGNNIRMRIISEISIVANM